MNETPSSASRLIEVFNAAGELPPGEERRRFLDGACGDDHALRAEVEQLLGAGEAGAEFLNTAAHDSGAEKTIVTRALSEQPGEHLGAYKLLEKIGEGGFGTVWVAEQERPLRRRVALKVLKPGMDSRQVLARFEAERQALAIMDHPNIATVHDGGATAAGRPFFVMELVKGVPVTEFCDQRQLPPRERLGLFLQICQAVQHAHQKGIIHRDLKPSNVLVAMHDTRPVVKVIDFGIAKALGQELTDRTMFTGFAQFMGTPLYMSPEQAGHSSLDVDTRSDIYSLGVLLYELLTGTTPFDRARFKQAAEDEIRRIIREEEPPRPSTRLSESKDTLPSISARRDTEPGKLTRLVRGELDWIVMKALEKDRSRRYETANGFALDVQHYLANEPVIACPPSTGYRLRKFVKRHKGGVAVAALVMLFLVLLGSGIGWAVRERSARESRVTGQVELVLAEVDQSLRGQNWSAALVAARRADAVVAGGEVSDATEQRVRELLKDLEFVDRLERIRMKRSDWSSTGKLDLADLGLEYEQSFRDYGVDAAALPVEKSIELLKARRPFAMPLAAALDHWAETGWYRKADRPGAQRLVAIARGIDPDPLRDKVRATWGKPAAEAGDELLQLAETIEVRAHHPATILNLEAYLQRVKRPDAALRLLREAQNAYPSDFWLNLALAQDLGERDDLEGAVRFYTAAVAIRPHAVAARNNLGLALKAQGRLDEAIACYRKAIEIDPNFAVAHSNLGIALRAQDKPDEAIACYRKAIELDPKNTFVYCNLGYALYMCGKEQEALAVCSEAVSIDPQSAHAHRNTALVLANASDAALRDPAQAVAHAEKAVELNPMNPDFRDMLGVALYRTGDYTAAIAAFDQARELYQSDDRTDWFFLAMTHWQLGNHEEARKWYDQSVEYLKKQEPAHEEQNRFRKEAAGLLGVEEAHE
jgi:serine/threonine protein kinase/tetratricopeptide (TPR) repeat protein